MQVECLSGTKHTGAPPGVKKHSAKVTGHWPLSGVTGLAQEDPHGHRGLKARQGLCAKGVLVCAHAYVCDTHTHTPRENLPLPLHTRKFSQMHRSHPSTRQEPCWLPKGLDII